MFEMFEIGDFVRIVNKESIYCYMTGVISNIVLNTNETSKVRVKIDNVGDVWFSENEISGIVEIYPSLWSYVVVTDNFDKFYNKVGIVIECTCNDRYYYKVAFDKDVIKTYPDVSLEVVKIEKLNLSVGDIVVSICDRRRGEIGVVHKIHEKGLTVIFNEYKEPSIYFYCSENEVKLVKRVDHDVITKGCNLKVGDHVKPIRERGFNYGKTHEKSNNYLRIGIITEEYVDKHNSFAGNMVFRVCFSPGNFEWFDAEDLEQVEVSEKIKVGSLVVNISKHNNGDCGIVRKVNAEKWGALYYTVTGINTMMTGIYPEDEIKLLRPDEQCCNDVASDVKTLQGRCIELHKKNNGKKRVAIRCNDVASDVKTLQEHCAQLQDEIDDLKIDNSALQSEFSEMEREKHQLEYEFDILRGEHENLLNKLAQARETFKEIKELLED